MARIVLLCVILSLCWHLIAAGSGIASGFTRPELTPELCANIEDSLLFPFRCQDTDKALGEAGRTFMKGRASENDLILDPVVILPGLGGSGLEAKLSKANVPHWYRCFVVAGSCILFFAYISFCDVVGTALGRLTGSESGCIWKNLPFRWVS
jgi:hypothetical protein